MEEIEAITTIPGIDLITGPNDLAGALGNTAWALRKLVAAMESDRDGGEEGRQGVWPCRSAIRSTRGPWPSAGSSASASCCGTAPEARLLRAMSQEVADVRRDITRAGRRRMRGRGQAAVDQARTMAHGGDDEESNRSGWGCWRRAVRDRHCGTGGRAHLVDPVGHQDNKKVVLEEVRKRFEAAVPGRGHPLTVLREGNMYPRSEPRRPPSGSRTSSLRHDDPEFIAAGWLADLPTASGGTTWSRTPRRLDAAGTGRQWGPGPSP